MSREARQEGIRKPTRQQGQAAAVGHGGAVHTTARPQQTAPRATHRRCRSCPWELGASDRQTHIIWWGNYTQIHS